MVTATTHDIEIRVETSFQPDYSVPNSAENIFAYRITILNKSHFTVQLLRRHWYIFDGPRLVREVEGEGVVGETPTLAPNEQHVYVSFCNLQSVIGRMEGSYTFIREFDEALFQVAIPSFTMAIPALAN
jgi:ApaG protein